MDGRTSDPSGQWSFSEGWVEEGRFGNSPSSTEHQGVSVGLRDVHPTPGGHFRWTRRRTKSHNVGGRAKAKETTRKTRMETDWVETGFDS